MAVTRPCVLDLWVAPDGHGTPTLWHRGDPPDHPQPVDPVAAVAAMLAAVADWPCDCRWEQDDVRGGNERHWVACDRCALVAAAVEATS